MTVGVGSLVAGRYRVAALVGAGGAADVYRARDERLGRDVALKVLRDHTGAGAERERFAAEARVVATLDHPSVVALLDAGLEDDQPWLAMQYVEGSSLSSVMVGAPLPDADVLRIAQQVAAGLAYAHASGVVHRDVKPGNILMASGGRALLADFGIARVIDSAVTRHTAAGQAIGSPAYLAPEQASGAEVSGATDVYALGLLLLEALTGRKPWTGTTAEVVFARLHAAPHVPEGVPEGWRGLLTWMTALDPADRPSAAEVVAELATWGAASEVPVDADATQRFTPAFDSSATRVLTTARRIPRRVVAGALLALLVLALLLWLLLRGPDESAGPEVPPVPSGIPAHLRDEVGDLHDAIHGGAR